MAVKAGKTVGDAIRRAYELTKHGAKKEWAMNT
jgi:hypothetical protein